MGGLNSFPFRDEVCRKRCPGPAEAGFTVNSDRLALRSMPVHKFYKLFCLVKRWRSAVSDRQTKERKSG